MEIRLFNSESNQLELLKPLKENEVSMYVCGPTVYGYVHIGNMRPVITFDILRRFLEYVGYKVSYTSNITDVDDKIINTALEEGISEKEVAKKYEENFFECCDKVNAKRPTNTPHVTETMDEIIAFINNLVELGYAYEKDGDVYFRVSKSDEYGCISHFKKENLKVGARIEENTKKEDPLDFALWKKTDVGIKWDSPWGKGRPGWHTECVVMINKNYSDGKIDIHGGGFDLKFPHHENEVAQSVACHGHHIASIWMHNGFINVDNVKMSKSLGNFKTANEVLSKHDGNIIRMIMISSHYRAPVNFSEEVMENAAKELNKILNPIRQAQIQLQINDVEANTLDEERMNKFLLTLADDLNTSNAISVIHETVKEINLSLRSKDYAKMSLATNTVLEMLEVLGIRVNNVVLDDEAKDLFRKWEEARKNKDFQTADVYRNLLIEKGLL